MPQLNIRMKEYSRQGNSKNELKERNSILLKGNKQ